MGTRVKSGTIIGETKLSIKHKNTPFDMNALAAFMHDWLLEEGFHDDTGSDDFIETYYWQESTQKGKNVWFWWRTFAGPEKTQSTYFEYHLDLECQILGLIDVETVVNDKKLKLNNGEVNINIKGYMVFDPNDLLKTHPFIKTIYNFFPKSWLHKEIDLHKKTSKKLTSDFYNAIKTHLEHYTLSEQFPNFAPNRGIEH